MNGIEEFAEIARFVENLGPGVPPVQYVVARPSDTREPSEASTDRPPDLAESVIASASVDHACPLVNLEQ